VIPHAEGVIRGIAYRPIDGDPMSEVEQCSVQPGRGIDLENRRAGKREVTFLAAEAWADTCRDLGTDLPWHTRRANFLIEGLDLAAAIGRTVTVGPVRVRIHGETKPCGLMDKQSHGLRESLVPACRGGVYGQILTAGTIRVGDPVEPQADFAD
jgi:MOSC domain-containing protein YiiM